MTKSMNKKAIKLNEANIPKHIGIIMDGNRRWATQKGLSVNEGHEAGAKALEILIDHCLELGVKILTVYALSTENWRSRARQEVQGIFGLLIRVVRSKREDYQRKGIKLAILGDFQAFPRKVVKAIEEILGIVKENELLKVNIALNYGGRDEILRAVKRIVDQKIPLNKIDEDMFGKYLYTKGETDPDLIIRTGGEIRLSNFLLWQMSYAELYFTDVLWPDFSPRELDKAIAEFQSRQRRFGK
jgi:undecaprenyl diphosphate synthase